MDFDLGNLAGFDPSPVDTEQFAADPDAACLTAARKITQALVAKLFSLPSEAADVGRVAQLPPPYNSATSSKAHSQTQGTHKVGEICSAEGHYKAQAQQGSVG